MSEFSGTGRIMTTLNSKMDPAPSKHPIPIASFLILIIISVTSLVQAQSSIHRKNAWMAQYSVDRLFHQAGYTIMTGESLGYLSQFSGSGVAVDANSGKMERQWPAIDGIVYCAVSDGTGGWYVGGTFARVDTVKVRNAVHINGDGSVDRTWKPLVSGPVRAIAYHGQAIYLGGFFNTINGTARNSAAAVNTAATLLPWNPNLDGGVYAFAIDENTIYVAGSFNHAGALVQTNVAAFDLINGTPASWAPVVSNTVNSVAVHKPSNTVFIAGDFTNAGGVARSKIARLRTDTADGAATSWVADVNIEGFVNSLFLRDGELIAAGNFSSVNGVPVNALVKLDIHQDANNVLAWNAQIVNGDVESIDVMDNTLYLAGNFNTIGSVSRDGLAAVNLVTAELQPWNPAPNDAVNLVVCDADNVFVGGDFNGLNTLLRTNIAIFKEGADEPLDLNIDLNGGKLFTVAVAGEIMYIGGEFSSVNGVARRNLAAVNLESGTVLDWAPEVSGTAPANISSVYTMELHGNLLYIGGQFTTITIAGVGIERNGLAALDITTGAPTAFNPTVGDGTSLSHRVHSLAIAGNKVYFGGIFTEVNGETRTGAAAVDKGTGTLLPWVPQIVNGTINKLSVTGSRVFVNGPFNGAVGGVQRHAGIAALDAESGETLEWNPDILGTVYDFVLTTDEIFVAGDFSLIGTEARNFIASFRLEDGSLTSWNPDVRRAGEAIPNISALAISPGRLHAGGWFEYLGDYNRYGYAQYDLCGSAAAITAQGMLLSATTGDSYQWYLNDTAIEGATNQALEISPIEFGRYSVEVTTGGCTNRSNEYVYLVTGSEQQSETTIAIFPNPITEYVLVRVSEPSRLELLDTNGHAVMMTSLAAGRDANRVNTANLGNGTYILRVTSAGGSSVFRIIKHN